MSMDGEDGRAEVCRLDGRGGGVLRLAAESDASGARGGPDRVGAGGALHAVGIFCAASVSAQRSAGEPWREIWVRVLFCVSSGHSAEVSALDDLLGDRERGCGR